MPFSPSAPPDVTLTAATTSPPRSPLAPHHPWSCLLFVLPLLLLYEGGLTLLGPPPETLRNGADSWLRAFLSHIGMDRAWGAPVLLVGLLIAWCLLDRAPAPADYVGTWVRMTAESAAFAALLFALSQMLFPLLVLLGGMLENPSDRFVSMGHALPPDEVWPLVVRYVGAGIYEETLFRLLLFSGVVLLLRQSDLGAAWSAVLGAILSALLFAGAHHFGTGGEHFHLAVFLFRSFAGLYFAALFYLRGFGIVVGAHAGYDVLVGLLLRFVGW
jgi:hypothetical protein